MHKQDISRNAYSGRQDPSSPGQIRAMSAMMMMMP